MLVKILRSSGSSIVAEGKAGVLYSEDGWSKAPAWLATKSYHLTYFTCLRHAIDCAKKNGWSGEVWEVRIRGRQPVLQLPCMLLTMYLNEGEIKTIAAHWPEGTRMAKRIRLVKRLGRFSGIVFTPKDGGAAYNCY